MAIAQTTITINNGFSRVDVINQFEDAFTWLEFHGDTQTGIITGMSSYSGGGTGVTGGVNATYQDVRQLSTSGIGTGASFFITRNSSGNISGVRVNRPGVGYTDEEVVQISGDSIGGISNGATTLELNVLVAGNENPVSYGSTTSYYDANKSGSFPWGIVRHTIEPNKKYGDTYRGIQVTSGGSASTFNIRLMSGNGFHPWDTTDLTDRGNYYSNRFAGEQYLDIPQSSINSTSNRLSTGSATTFHIQSSSSSQITISSSNGSAFGLDLNVYRSSLDPKFAVFSYHQPTLSSTHLTGNTFGTFLFHNFTTNLWDLDELFLGGVTLIDPTTGNTTSPRIQFITYNGGNSTFLSTSGVYRVSIRCAEMGYSRALDTAGRNSDGFPSLSTTYSSNAYNQSKTNTNNRIYYRNNSQDQVKVGTNSDFNAVIKGIPLSGVMVPCPYYLPDDFVLIDFDYGVSGQNIQQGDTITISPSEVYTVITGSYNQTTRTRGILFCARTN
jgi:hypothetical protein